MFLYRAIACTYDSQKNKRILCDAGYKKAKSWRNDISSSFLVTGTTVSAPCAMTPAHRCNTAVTASETCPLMNAPLRKEPAGSVWRRLLI